MVIPPLAPHKEIYTIIQSVKVQRNYSDKFTEDALTTFPCNADFFFFFCLSFLNGSTMNSGFSRRVPMPILDSGMDAIDELGLNFFFNCLKNLTSSTTDYLIH